MENTAKFAGGNYIKARYIDVIEPKKVDTRTGDEIVDRHTFSHLLIIQSLHLQTLKVTQFHGQALVD